jgi:lipopolysaccharide export system protein LptA
MIAACAIACLANGAAAQDALTERFGGMSGSSNEPIDIESDTLEVDDRAKTAIFKGDVKARQGGMTLQSRELEIIYVGQGADAVAGAAKPQEAKADAAKADGGQKAEIKTIHARGGVLLSTDKEQSATSDWALFDVAAQTVTIGGNVVLSQGENVIRGDRLVVDLKTGQSKFDTEEGLVSQSGSGGRVKGLFMPKQSGKSDDAPAAAPADN